MDIIVKFIVLCHNILLLAVNLESCGQTEPLYPFRTIVKFRNNITTVYSLRVNLEMGKTFYSWTIQRDKKIEGTVMRSTTIPEELGRIQYLLADKTGTLTKNEMVFQKLHLGNALFDKNNFYEVSILIIQVH